MKCPSCDGQGLRQTTAFVRRGGTGCTIEELVLHCRVCDGRGDATAEDLGRYEAGLRMRRERIIQGEGLRESARRLGISPPTLSALERGHRC